MTHILIVLAEKNHTFDLLHLQASFWNTWTPFSFNSVKYKNILTKLYFHPLSANQQDLNNIVIKKVRQFVSSKFEDGLLRDKKIFSVGPNSLNLIREI